MLKSFKVKVSMVDARPRGVRFWLQATAIVLALLNAAALYLYLDPPGGSRGELNAESQRLTNAIFAQRAQTARLKKISSNVQLGSEQAQQFEARYIVPKRQAYVEVLSEIERMSNEAGITPRDATWLEEPIEGSDDLSVLTNTMNFEGSYENLMDFLYEVDHSPKMLILDRLTASPQKDGSITAQMRFQTIIREGAEDNAPDSNSTPPSTGVGAP